MKSFPKIKIILLILFFLGTIGLTNETRAADPFLNFSDLTSGPAVGLGDGLGSGAIVTVWGNNLEIPTIIDGVPQGNYHVYVGSGSNWVEASYVYEWRNANYHTGHPTELYDYHKMQDIMFSLGSATPAGDQQIKVVVNGVESTTLPFTVRNGNIYHVKTGGSDLNSGSWSQPLATIQYFIGTNGQFNPPVGSILYVGDGFDSGGSLWTTINGIQAAPYFIAAYPGSNVIIRSNLSDTYAAWGGNGSIGTVEQHTYNHISKVTFYALATCVSSIPYGRVIGTECTQYPGHPLLVNTMSGYFLQGQQPANIAYGNYIHDVGSQGSMIYSNVHTTYFSNRCNGINWGDECPSRLPYDFGWNFLKDNLANHGIHMYDELAVGGWAGTCRIHDNVVVNQRGVGLGIGCGGRSPYTCENEFDVYNNLLINTGQGPCLTDDGVTFTHGVNRYGMAMGVASWSAEAYGARFHVKAWNNTIYGYGDNTNDLSSCGSTFNDPSSTGAVSFGAVIGSLNWRNNIVVDTKNIPYTPTQYVDNAAPTYHTNNLWYSTDQNHDGPPSWDISPLVLDPLFVNANGNNFNLLSDSPARDSGWDVSSVLTCDILGTNRPQGLGWDIGAFEYFDGSDDTTAPTVPSGLRID